MSKNKKWWKIAYVQRSDNCIFYTKDFVCHLSENESRNCERKFCPIRTNKKSYFNLNAK